MSKANKIFMGIVITAMFIWVIAISINTKETKVEKATSDIERITVQKAAESTETAEIETIEEIYTETVNEAYFEPQEVTEYEEYQYNNTDYSDYYDGGFDGGDYGSNQVVYDSYELDGWTYFNEPNQWNSTYMGVHKITNTASLQWQWLQSHDWSYTDEGICCYDGRILVALTPIFGTIGDYVDLLLEDGTILYCIIGDVKWNSDTYGHWNNGYLNVLEIIVSEDWYNGHENKYYPAVIAYR